MLVPWWPAKIWHVDLVPLIVSGFHVLCYASEGRRWVIVGIIVGRVVTRQSVTGGAVLREIKNFVKCD